MVYEDLTVKGAIKKALGKKPSSYGKPSNSYSKQQTATKKPTYGTSKIQRAIRGRAETFNDLPLGARISGTGRSGFPSVSGAVQSAANEMESLAWRYYRDRYESIRSGARHAGVMIPELAAAIEASGSSFGSLTYGYSSIRAGLRRSDGSGSFAVPYSSELAAVVHVHWLDNFSSTDDDRKKFEVLREARSDRNRTLVDPEDIEFYVYSIRSGIRSY